MNELEEYVFNLFDEKSSHLAYHNKKHTQEVLAAATKIARKEGVSDEELLLVQIAALFHDTGYFYYEKGHEEKSCEIARDVLPNYGFLQSQIEQICCIIMATKIPQDPKNHLAEILCDADLSYLGSDAYKEYADRLYLEQQNFHRAENPNVWTHQQINFLKDHRFFTGTAKQEFDEKKLKHLAELKKKLQKRKSHKNAKTNFITEEIPQTVLGILLSAFALKSFLVPNNFFDGGINGVSLLIHKIYHLDLSVVLFFANLPFMFLAKNIINKRFAVKTCICVILLSATLFIPFPVIITSDNVLVAIFGGFFFGLGNGLVLRAGSSLDGIEILAFYTKRKTGFTNTEIIFVINFLIFLIAAIKFDIRIAMYSMITYFTASKTIDYVVEGIEAYTGVTIISQKSEILKSRLVNELGRGITIYKGERGYLPDSFDTHNDVDIIFTVVTRLELKKLKDTVYETDPTAFVYVSVIREASGGILKKGLAH